MKPRHIGRLLSAVLLTQFGFAHSSHAGAGQYKEPAYVDALLAGNVSALASPDSLQWDSVVRRLSIKSNRSIESIESMLKMDRKQSRKVPPGGFSQEQLLEILQSELQQLDTTHIRRPVFRAHYIAAFAANLIDRCTFLTAQTSQEVREMHNAAVDSLGVGDAQAVQSKPRTPAMKEAARWLHEALYHGQSDAREFFKANDCTSPGMRAMIASLTALLAPSRSAAAGPTGKRANDLRSAMIERRDYDFIIGGRIVRDIASQGPLDPMVRTYVTRNPYDTTLKGSEELSAYMIPGIEEERAGTTIGWHVDDAFLDVGKGDGKPTLLIMTSPGAVCGGCAQLVDGVLRSRPLNALAGRFHAVLLADDGVKGGLFAQLRKWIKPVRLAVPSVYLVQFGDRSTPAKVLWRRERAIDAQDLAKEIEPLLPARSPTLGEIAKPAKHEFSPRLPGFCWMIESYELCQARLRRGAHQE